MTVINLLIAFLLSVYSAVPVFQSAVCKNEKGIKVCLSKAYPDSLTLTIKNISSDTVFIRKDFFAYLMRIRNTEIKMFGINNFSGSGGTVYRINLYQLPPDSVLVWDFNTYKEQGYHLSEIDSIIVRPHYYHGHSWRIKQDGDKMYVWDYDYNAALGPKLVFE